MGRNTKNEGNQGCDVDGNVSREAEMTQNSNGNDKFKEWR